MNENVRAVLTTARGMHGRIVWLMLMAGMSLVLALASEDGRLRLTFMILALTMLILSFIVSLAEHWERSRKHHLQRRFSRLVRNDAAPCFMTDIQGHVCFGNKAAIDRFGEETAHGLLGVLERYVSTPAALLYRLVRQADMAGAAHEDILTAQGTLRLAVHATGRDSYFWRLDEFSGRRSAKEMFPPFVPMLVADETRAISSSNEALGELLGKAPERLDQVLPNQDYQTGDQVGIITTRGERQAVIIENAPNMRQREIHLLPIAPAESGSDLTDFDNVPVPIMKFAADGALYAANRAARDLMGEDSPASSFFYEMFEDLGRPVSDWLRDVVTGRLPTGIEVLKLTGVARESFVQVQLSRIVEDGEVGALAILADATALKQLEAKFNQSQKMQAIGQLAGGIAHDFNNLLTAISGHCDLLLLRHGRDDSDFADLEQIRQNANRAAGLVSQLLAFSRKQPIRPEELDLQVVLGDVSHLLNRLVGETVGLELSYGANLTHVRADRRQLEQVLMNLVINARDAMPQGGLIGISTENLSLQEPLPKGAVTVPAGNYSIIRVRDSGHGIAPDKIDSIFDPFFTTKRPGEGTGLGLATVYGIIKQAGGYIFVESELDKGTVFEVLLPAFHPDEEAEAALAGPGSSDPGRTGFCRDGEGVVLLVEDEAPVRAFASRALRLRGYHVVEAGTAEEALEILKDAQLKVDVFVTDVVMPGLDGPSWVKEALKDRPEVKVVFVSGYTDDVLAEVQARIPHSVFLPKPFSLVELIATVQKQFQV